MNFKRASVYITIFFSFGYFSCCSSNQTTKNDSMNGKSLANSMEKIPPGVSRFVGTIVSVDSVLSTGKKDPCSIQPCWAEVQVDSIIGYGAGSQPVSLNEKVKTKFAFTLGPTTKDLFPNLDNRLPGLNIGDKFMANFSNYRNVNLDNKTQIIEFIVYSYSLVK